MSPEQSMKYRYSLNTGKWAMKIWHAKLATGLGTILLGLSASVFAQEQDSAGQEPPNKALLATEIEEESG